METATKRAKADAIVKRDHERRRKGRQAEAVTYSGWINVVGFGPTRVARGCKSVEVARCDAGCVVGAATPVLVVQDGIAPTDAMFKSARPGAIGAKSCGTSACTGCSCKGKSAKTVKNLGRTKKRC